MYAHVFNICTYLPLPLGEELDRGTVWLTWTCLGEVRLGVGCLEVTRVVPKCVIGQDIMCIAYSCMHSISLYAHVFNICTYLPLPPGEELDRGTAWLTWTCLGEVRLPRGRLSGGDQSSP